MRISRRRFVSLSAGAAGLPVVTHIARAETHAAQPAPEPGQSLADRLSAYASALRYDDLDAATLERVKTLVIDTLGCGLGAWDERPVRACREIALSVDGPATIVCTMRRTTADLAAFANCAATRYLDFNDTYVGRFAAH